MRSMILPLSLVFTPAPAANVITYHYDNLRTGWNQAEATLTPANIGGGAFGLLAQVPLDEQVDAQPLFLAGQTIGGATHDVVYVATENNTIYAIDAKSGQILLSRHYSPPVPIAQLPGGCQNNSDHVGITATPVIDPASQTLYAITDGFENGAFVLRLHAVSVATLLDLVPPKVIDGSAPLTNGFREKLAAASNRQRAALIETGGAIYAGFASWCDVDTNTSRGWVLGWNAATMAPLPSSDLLNRKPTSKNDYFLSSVWMSGYGIASDDQGSLFFATGNSDPAGRSYNPVSNLEESVVKLATDLTAVTDYFTPAGGRDGWSYFDTIDGDFGAGGVLLLPDQPGAVPHLAVAAGKLGPMYLLNRDNLGKLGTPKVTLGAYPNGGCWCGQSYYTGADGIGRVVASTGYNVTVWQVQTAPRPALVQESRSATLGGVQDPGFFTTISSNGTAQGTAVIWAVERPTNFTTETVSLKAFYPARGSAQIFAGVAGTWPFAGTADADLVPVVANGHVFVASYRNLSIFGLAGGAVKPMSFQPPVAWPPARLHPTKRHSS